MEMHLRSLEFKDEDFAAYALQDEETSRYETMHQALGEALRREGQAAADENQSHEEV